MKTLEVHLISHNEEPFLPWALRHWAVMGAKVTVHDGSGSEGLSTKLAALFGFEAKPFDTSGQLNDELARKLKNECWKGTAADWVICVDADELIHFPMGVQPTLEALDRGGAAVIKPMGFEMFSETWFDPHWHQNRQVTDLVKDGAPDDKWYSKPVLFSPKRVAETGFGYGAHESNPVLMDGRRLVVDGKYPRTAAVQLLHYHQIGSVERLAARYDATRARFSAFNNRARLGNFTDGALHVQQKRDLILPSLRRVIE